jgi:hypothetical protein
MIAEAEVETDEEQSRDFKRIHLDKIVKKKNNNNRYRAEDGGRAC